MRVTYELFKYRLKFSKSNANQQLLCNGIANVEISINLRPHSHIQTKVTIGSESLCIKSNKSIERKNLKFHFEIDAKPKESAEEQALNTRISSVPYHRTMMITA